MTTVTATTEAGTKGRKVTVVHTDGRTFTFTDKNSRFYAIVSDAGTDMIANGSATADGAARGTGARGVRNGVWTNLRVIPVTQN